MSKIPRSFVTPNPKQTALTPAVSLEVLHQKNADIKTPAPRTIKKGPLCEVNSVKRNAEVKMNTNGKSGSGVKRNAPASQYLPNKQIKLSSKPVNSNVKIPPYDYKAKFNDLSEKHIFLNTEYVELQEKYNENINEHTSTKSTLESLASQVSTSTINIEKLSKENDKLKIECDELRIRCESDRVISLEFKKTIEDLNRQVSTVNESNLLLSTKLTEVNQQLQNKSSEFAAVKDAFEKEAQKCLQLSGIIEESQVKLQSLSSEVIFLKTRQKIIDQKNEENLLLISNLKQENQEMTEKYLKCESDRMYIQNRFDEKNLECDKTTVLLNVNKQKCEELNNVLDKNHRKIISNTTEIIELNKFKELLELKNEESLKQIDTLNQKNAELEKTIEAMHENQKVLRNNIQDLKGHIRVFCRIRPSLLDENLKPTLKVDVMDSCTMEIDKTSLNIASGLTKKQNFKHNFSFDGIFPPNSLQTDVFAEVSGLIHSALDGYNVCIFAYGQTGSGKTYTMEGSMHSNSMGIIPRAIDMIFHSLSDLKKIGWAFTITASFLEIYNENIYDLLDSKREQEEHAIKMVDSKGSDVYVSNLKEEWVKNSDDLMKLLLTSQKNRQTAATFCNERSSRSHSVTKIKISAHNEKRKEKYTSSINLVDLAGSESAKTSQRMDETKSINKSLSELSKVILALQSKQNHVPYRNSKLTHLLMPSLGGNSKTLMLVNIAQLDECYQETLNSLRFAAKVNSCRNGVSKKNISTA